MKKKVFFVLSSLRAGGSERVFWLVAQYFNKSDYDVTMVILDGRNSFFSHHMNGVELIDLNTINASKSFFPLYRLLKKEKPYAVFVTGSHINTLLASVSFFLSHPILIARESNIPHQMVRYASKKGRLVNLLIKKLYKRFDKVVCQSVEMQQSLAEVYSLDLKKLVVIPNPVIPVNIEKQLSHNPVKHLIIVARLSHEKGHIRLLEIIQKLPQNYHLTIAGDGPLKSDIEQKIVQLNIADRVKMVGQVSKVTALIAQHDLMVLSSFTEGFPNVIIESLSVGTPVVAFEVGGLSHIIANDFNGYIVPQGDIQQFANQVIAACNKSWDTTAIKKDAENKFGINEVVAKYTELIR